MSSSPEGSAAEADDAAVVADELLTGLGILGAHKEVMLQKIYSMIGTSIE